MSKLVIMFTLPALNHWLPRFSASGEFTEVGFASSPQIINDDLIGVPWPVNDTIYLVNAAVGKILSSHPKENRRKDIYVLPVGAPQDNTPVGLDFLVRV